MKVTIGRIVQYRTTESDRDMMFKGRSVRGDITKVLNVRSELPSIVTAVFDDGRVNVQVILDGQIGFMWATNLKQGDEEGEWNWFPRV